MCAISEHRPDAPGNDPLSAMRNTEGMFIAAIALALVASGVLLAGLTGLVAAEGRVDTDTRGADLV